SADDVVAHDRRSPRREVERVTTTETVTGAGDDHDLTVETDRRGRHPGVEASPYTMNSSRLPSGSRTYVLVPLTRRPPSRWTGPSATAAPTSVNKACNASTVPSHTKHRSPQGGTAAGARNVNASRRHTSGRCRLIICCPARTRTTARCSSTSKPRAR